MVFLDTCVWIELCSVKSPSTQNEIRQANEASRLLAQLLSSKEEIVSCKEQLIEVISAIEKIKLREYSRTEKMNGRKGCGDLKEFRGNQQQFELTKQLCKSVIEDILHFATIKEYSYSIADILEKMNLADLNDCIYYDYCMSNGISLYTFDGDIKNLGENENIHVM